MRVFVTGATGFIGSAIVQELTRTGHEVLGLARNDEAEAALTRLGIAAHRGDLTDPESLAAGARACDGVIHTAFIHDFSAFMASIEIDRVAVEAMAKALEGSDRPLVIASGTLMVAHGRPATEETAPLSRAAPRAGTEFAVIEAAERGVRGVVVRLPPPVHDVTRAGLLSRIGPMAREKGVSAYLGAGENVWPSVHHLDAARLFCLAVEKAAPGARLHAVAEEGIPMRKIAEAMGERLGVPTRSVAMEDAGDFFGPFAGFVALDNPTTSQITRETMGWSPREVGLLADIAAAEYLV